MVIQLEFSVAVQPHPDWVVTENEPVPPALVKLLVVGLTL